MFSHQSVGNPKTRTDPTRGGTDQDSLHLVQLDAGDQGRIDSARDSRRSKQSPEERSRLLLSEENYSMDMNEHYASPFEHAEMGWSQPLDFKVSNSFFSGTSVQEMKQRTWKELWGDSFHAFDLQEEIYKAVPGSTIILPDQLIVLGKITIDKPLVFRGGASTQLQVYGHFEINIESSMVSPRIDLSKSRDARSNHQSPISSRETKVECLGEFCNVYNENLIAFQNVQLVKAQGKSEKGPLPNFLFNTQGGVSLSFKDVVCESNVQNTTLLCNKSVCRQFIAISSLFKGFKVILHENSTQVQSFMSCGFEDCGGSSSVYHDYIETSRGVNSFLSKPSENSNPQDFNSIIFAANPLILQIIDCKFANFSSSCIRLEFRDASKPAAVQILETKFEGGAHNCITLKGFGAASSKLKIIIESCLFTGGEKAQLRLITLIPRSIKILFCNFSKCASESIFLDGCANYSIDDCNFSDIESECLLVCGGRGSVRASNFNNCLSGIKIFGETRTKMTNFGFGNSGLNDSNKIDITGCVLENLRGAGVEVTDSMWIEFSMSKCKIQKCINGLLVKDFDQNFQMKSLPTSTLKYTVDSSSFLSNRGCGIKLENISVQVILTKSEAKANTDYAVGVIGDLKQSITISPDCKLQGAVQALPSYGHDTPEHQQCSLI